MCVTRQHGAVSGTFTAAWNRLGVKATTLKSKAKAKDLAPKAKAKAKDMTSCPQGASSPRPLEDSISGVKYSFSVNSTSDVLF